MLLPKTKRELRNSYAFKAKDLYLKLLDGDPDPFIWKPEELQHTAILKQTLITAIVLPLPSLEKCCHLFATVDWGIALGILTQEHEGQRQPVTLKNFLTMFLGDGQIMYSLWQLLLCWWRKTES
jgi:hypothetical protein